MNSKKRKQIENDSDSNENEIITYKRFKEETISYRGLQAIAGTIGFPKNGKKELLYKSIENYLKNKEMIENDSTMIEQINTFNKEQPKLITTIDGIGIDSIEFSFWKIFRNKVLFKNIFSNFKNNKLFTYNDIIDVVTLNSRYSNNSNSLKEIIIDKIKNGAINIIKDKSDLQIIFQRINKKNQENLLFYNFIFTNYSTKSSIFKIDNNIEKWLPILVSNLMVLEEYIKFFNLTDKNVIKKAVLSLLRNRFLSNPISYEKLKIFNFFKSNGYLPSFKKPISIISLDMISFRLKFKRLIKIQNLFSNYYIENKNKNNDSSNDDNKIKQHQDLLKLISELNEIYPLINKEILKLNVSQILESNQSELQINENYTLRDIISKYHESINIIHSLYYNSEISMIVDYVYFKKDLSYIANTLASFKYTIRNYIDGLFIFSFKSKNERIELISSFFNKDENGIISQLKLFINDNNNNNNNNHYLYPNNKINSMADSICSSIFSTQDIEIIDYFFKKLSSTTETTTDTIFLDTSIDKIINSNINLIKSKKLLNYLFKNYLDHPLFQDGNEKWLPLTQFQLSRDFGRTTTTAAYDDDDDGNEISIFQHYENLMQSVQRKLTLNITNRIHNYENLIFIFERAIQKSTTIYNLKFTTTNSYSNENDNNQLLNSLFGFYKIISDFQQQQSFISILSNVQLKYSIDINSICYYVGSNFAIKNYLFANITKETIALKIKQELDKYDNSNGNYPRDINIEFTITPPPTTTTTTEFEDFIEKPKSIKFNIQIDNLLAYLYETNRIQDIIYIFDTVPNILPIYFNFFTYFYKNCSSYYLEIFINYFIENLNQEKDCINHLYHCLVVASKNGFIQIFKKLYSNHQNLLFIKTSNSSKQNQTSSSSSSSSSSLFESNLLYDLVAFSVNSHHLELSNLLIKFINFSKLDDVPLRTIITKKIKKLNNLK